MRAYTENVGVATFIFLLAAGTLGAADAAKGKEIYEKKCAMCHAKDLKGNPAMAKVFKLNPSVLSLLSKQVLDQKDADLIATTIQGKGKMPPQKGKLTPDEIANSIAYIRSAAPPAK